MKAWCRWLPSWLFLSAGDKSDAKMRIVMYTRQGCHLCEDAWRLLQSEQQRFGFELESIDVDQSEKLRAEHGEHVPVVAVDGKVRFRGQVNRVLLARLFRSAS